MKATEQYFPVIVFIMLYKMVLTFESVDEILKYDHSNQSYQLLSTGRTIPKKDLYMQPYVPYTLAISKYM